MFGFFSIFFMIVWVLLIAGVAGFAIQQGVRKNKKTGQRQANIASASFLGGIALLMIIVMLPGAITTGNVYGFQRAALNLESEVSS